jgi:hypothetical protein
MVEFRNQIPGLKRKFIVPVCLKTKLKILLNVKVSIKRGCQNCEGGINSF